jgi:hypothetical protein
MMISGNDFGPNYNQTLTESSLTATTRTAQAITHCEQPIPCSEVKSPNNTHADLVCEVSAPSMDDDDVYYYSCGRIVSKKNSCFFFDTLTLNFLFFLDRWFLLLLLPVPRMGTDFHVFQSIPGRHRVQPSVQPVPLVLGRGNVHG